MEQDFKFHFQLSVVCFPYILYLGTQGHLLHTMYILTDITKVYNCGYTSCCTGKGVVYDQICRLLLFPLLRTPFPLPFFIASSLSSLSMSLALFLSLPPPLPISLPYLPIFLCQYADTVWGLGKEGDIKSGLWLCVCFSSQGCD